MTFPKSLRIAALTAAGAAALSSCSSSDSGSGGGGAGADGTRGAMLNLGQIQDIRSWDPGQAGVGPQLVPYQLAYDTLILREPDGTLSPMLATEWGYTDDTNTTFSLDLRTDVTFSDGAALDAEAVKANLDHFRTANGPQANQLADVSEVTAVDEDTVEIRLSQPNPALDYYLSQAAGLVASPEQLASDELAAAPVGTGPFEMDTTSSVAGNQYVFTARDDYWNPDLQHWDAITLKVLSDSAARVNAVTSGQVDAVPLDARTVGQAEGSGVDVVTYDSDWMGLLLFDRGGEVNPELADVRVRQAINYAFDRDTILAQLGGGYGDVTGQVFGTNSSAYVEELDEAYGFDPDRARELLTEAGYPDGFTLTVPLAEPMSSVAPFFVQPLADIGITVETTSVPVQNYQTELGSGNYAAGWWVLFQGPSWVAIQQLLSTEALYNPFDSTDAELQGLIDRVRAGGSDGDAAAQELNQYLVDQAWFAPWFRQQGILAVRGDTVQVEPQVEQAVPSIYNYTPAG
ncbi:ABC transporter substrate-binding protein [Blastococcus sp. SYSU D00820]